VKEQSIPYFLSQLAKNETLANQVWDILQYVEMPSLQADPIKLFERKFIILSIIEGKHLAPKDPNGFSDPYLKISYAGYNNKTKIISKTLDPKWGKVMNPDEYKAETTYPNNDIPNVFKIPYRPDISIYSDIIIECRDCDETGVQMKDDFMGIFLVPTLKSINEVEFYLLESVKTANKKKILLKTSAKTEENTKEKTEENTKEKTEENTKEKTAMSSKSFAHVSGTITISLMFADENGIEKDE